jgi:hypothetical protein
MDDKALIPFADLEKMSEVMAKTGMFGKNAEQLISLMLIAQAEGIHPARAAQEYDVIQGRPALKAQAALARFQETGGRIKWITRTDTECEAEFSHPKGDPVSVKWDMEKAKKRGLADKDNWKKMPGTMLMWRTASEGIRICCPACLNRLYIEYEVEDMEYIKPAITEDVMEMQNVTDSCGNFAPEIDPGEPAKRGDGIATEMQALKVRIMNCNTSEVFTPDERKDMVADYHPGGRNVTNSQNDLDYLKGIVEKWETLRDTRIEKRNAELDEAAEEGFANAMGKDG